ncbi:MAG: SBBP repeat-containing protein, partial [Candidatus Zixiibacteriota bacterium]
MDAIKRLITSSHIFLPCLIFLTLTPVLSGAQEVSQAEPHNISALEGIASMRLAFTENTGQWNQDVLFRANAGNATMWLTAGGIHYQFVRRVLDVPYEEQPLLRNLPDDETLKIECLTVRAERTGANPRPDVTGNELLGYRCNYFLDNDPAKWRTNVPNFGEVTYRDIYPGIDLKYYGDGQQMEYDFIVSPGADPSQVQIQYQGIKSLSVNESGDLIITTDWGEIIERKPVVYQTVEGTKKSVAAEFQITAVNMIGFKLSDDYDPSLPVFIDPVLVYGTYLGGGADDYASGIAVDSSGNSYVTGHTYSSDFPVVNGY